MFNVCKLKQKREKMITLIDKKIKTKYNFTVLASFWWFSLGIDYACYYFPDERTGKEVDFQKDITLRLPFLIIKISKHIS